MLVLVLGFAGRRVEARRIMLMGLVRGMRMGRMYLGGGMVGVVGGIVGVGGRGMLGERFR